MLIFWSYRPEDEYDEEDKEQNKENGNDHHLFRRNKLVSGLFQADNIRIFGLQEEPAHDIDRLHDALPIVSLPEFEYQVLPGNPPQQRSRKGAFDAIAHFPAERPVIGRDEEKQPIIAAFLSDFIQLCNFQGIFLQRRILGNLLFDKDEKLDAVGLLLKASQAAFEGG